MAKWHVAPLRFAPAFRALGVCEHIWLRYKNFDPSCFDPIQKIWYVDLRTNSDFRSRSFDLLPPTRRTPLPFGFARQPIHIETSNLAHIFKYPKRTPRLNFNVIHLLYPLLPFTCVVFKLIDSKCKDCYSAIWPRYGHSVEIGDIKLCKHSIWAHLTNLQNLPYGLVTWPKISSWPIIML